MKETVGWLAIAFYGVLIAQNMIDGRLYGAAAALSLVVLAAVWISDERVTVVTPTIFLP